MRPRLRTYLNQEVEGDKHHKLANERCYGHNLQITPRITPHLRIRVLQCGGNQLVNAKDDHDARHARVQRGHHVRGLEVVELESELNGGERLRDRRQQGPLHRLPLATGLCLLGLEPFGAAVDGQRDGDAFRDVVESDRHGNGETASRALRQVVDHVLEGQRRRRGEGAHADDGGVEDDQALGEVVETDAQRRHDSHALQLGLFLVLAVGVLLLLGDEIGEEEEEGHAAEHPHVAFKHAVLAEIVGGVHHDVHIGDLE